MRSAWTAAAFVLLLVAGCSAPPREAAATATTAPPPATTTFSVGCSVTSGQGSPLEGATCAYRFPGLSRDVATGADGQTSLRVPEGATGTLAAIHDGYASSGIATVRADADKTIQFTLAPAPATDSGTATDTATVPATQTTTPGTPAPRVPVRGWKAPVAVMTLSAGNSGPEPMVAVAPDGTIYVAPINWLFRSVDGGRTFEDISPNLAEALPFVGGGDTSVSVAPDGSLWWSRYWSYLGGTIGCTSTNRGDSWVCDNAAIPGVTDRMWIVGLDSQHGYLQTGEGLSDPVWAETITGSLKYTPYAVSGHLYQHGNMAMDESTGAVWQITELGAQMETIRVDGALGIITPKAIGVPASPSIPWLSVRDGVLWTASVDGNHVVVAHGAGGSADWDVTTVSSQPLAVSFPYVAAGPDGRVAVMYYGSDAAGDPGANTGTWSLYVAETEDARVAHPVWVETKVQGGLHAGPLCTSLGCPSDNRWAGDLSGAWVDGKGDVHIAYVKTDGAGNMVTMYVRETVA